MRKHLKRYYGLSYNRRQNFALQQILILLLFICSISAISWIISSWLDVVSSKSGTPFLIAWLVALSFVGVVVARWTTLPQLAAPKRGKDQLQKAYDELEHQLEERTTELAKLAALLEESQGRLTALIDSLPGIAFFCANTPEYPMTYVSEGCLALTGYTSEELVGEHRANNYNAITHPDDLPKVLNAIKTGIALRQPYVVEYRIRAKSGEEKWLWEKGNLVLHGNDQIVGVKGFITDLTQRKHMEEALQHSAFHDSLTGLANRALFIDRLQQALHQVKQHQEAQFAVLFLDLDRFKVINDSLGHLMGDQFLIAIASRLVACLHPTDTVARLGGDEFTILMEGFKDLSDVFYIADRIQGELSLPFELHGQEVFTTVSIGIAPSTIGFERPEDILRAADTAMYRAKALGRARYEVFDLDMYTQAVARLQLEIDLWHALDRQEFKVYYQPIVAFNSGRIAGFEALIRWQHPDRGLVTPSDFIPVAEETGQIVQIGYWVLRCACYQMQAWLERNYSALPLRISVNLSFKQFSQSDLTQQIQQILHETGLPASCLVLEITESVIMENVAFATAVLSQLQALGIHLSIDDFGTGYSSLARLHHFPIRGLKIDRSFVSSPNASLGSCEIVETIATLARKLGIDITAEGVETQEQLAILRGLKCEYGQGYLFSSPLNREESEALLLASPQW
ncbi:MAG: EAL domain-containing protein [Chroococcidiopsidaceae cyanobacterium CP_BM_ER_R8_30]|nr:EAL domain-containing protein [Chroococcidiopsidaceae cyanobacterium CP_BM_ER_R8_30]